MIFIHIFVLCWFQELTHEFISRDKRKVEAITGVKNAVLGFVFNAHHIYPPADPVHSLSSIISGVIGQKLHAVGPFLTLVTSKLSGGSHGGAHKGWDFGGHAGATAHGAAI
ncbi:hypothetical protein NQ317_006160 [Molorchus minor]|uniref:Uncharacterized protein n=1 Tax=Molorchus minor TaxID=1323400 RepID=A0ABQ9J9P4_9CUCU|nr:hypothetical protein NQ317_006160 [Molorchus minor]